MKYHLHFNEEKNRLFAQGQPILKLGMIFIYFSCCLLLNGWDRGKMDGVLYITKISQKKQIEQL